MSNDNPNHGVGSGISLRGEHSVLALSDGKSHVVVPGDQGTPGVPTAVRTTGNGVIIDSGKKYDSDSRTVDVLPRYPDVKKGHLEFDQAQKELALTQFLEVAWSGWLKKASESLSRLQVSKPDPELAVRRPVISVPGGYDWEDRESVSRAASGAGLNPGEIVRAPLPTAAAAFPDLTGPSNVVAIHIGSWWSDVAIIEIDPDETTYRVRSRKSIPGIGRETIDSTVAKWAIHKKGKEFGEKIDFPPGVFNRVKEAAHAAIAELAENGEAGIVVPDIKNIEGSSVPSSFDVNIDITTVDSYEVLEETIDELVYQFRHVLEDTDMDRDQINAITVSGKGAAPPAVQRAIEGFFGQPPTVPSSSELAEIPALGTAILAWQLQRLESDENLIVRETLSREIVGTLAGQDGLCIETLAPATTGQDSTLTHTFKTTENNQTRALLQIGYRHLVTGEIEHHRVIEITDIPPRKGGETEIKIRLGVNRIPEDGLDIEATVSDRTIEGEIDRSLSVRTSKNFKKGPWLTLPDTNIESLELPERFDEFEYARLQDPIDKKLDELSPRTVVERVIDARYKLWKVKQAEEPLEPSEVETALETFDDGLRRIKVEPIDPDEGDPKDLSKHNVWQTEKSPQPDGTIVRVRKPGYKIGEQVHEPADVIESQGTNTESDGDTESTAELEGSEQGTNASSVGSTGDDSNASTAGTGDEQTIKENPKNDTTWVKETDDDDRTTESIQEDVNEREIGQPEDSKESTETDDNREGSK